MAGFDLQGWVERLVAPVQRAADRDPRRTRRMLGGATVLCLALMGAVAVAQSGGSASSGNGAGGVGCSTADGRRAITQLRDDLQRWDDAVTLAQATPRISLAPQSAALQGIRRDVDAQYWPPCATAAGGDLTTSMQDTIDGFVAFLGQQPDSVATDDFNRATDALKEYQADLAKIPH